MLEPSGIVPEQIINNWAMDLFTKRLEFVEIHNFPHPLGFTMLFGSKPGHK